VAVAADVIMPSLGFDMTEGTLARWLKKEGEPVEKGEPIAEIETEKATVEIEATASGVLTQVVVQPGQIVAVGTVMARIAPAGAKGAERPPKGTKAPPPAVPEGSGPSPPAPSPGVGRKREEEVAAPSQDRVKASPVARRMAAEAGIDLARIRGTGPGGRVMERDVQEATAEKTPPAAPEERAAPAPAGSAPPGSPAPAGAAALNKMRLAIARRMTESKTTAPHFYVTVEINMDEAVGMREQLNRLASESEKITVTDLIVAAAARTLARFPNLNASYREGALVQHPGIHLGIATALEEGLITPVLRDADRKPLKTIAAESRALGTRARSNKLRAEDLGSGTFTVSNLGMFGVDEFTAIINPPEAAILAVGAVTRRPVAVGDDVRIASVMKATLSVDHRVADGAQAGRFLREFRKLMENPINLLSG
jgi:pyruvate dehydrogenase E2 component (dihydrolipoamide acetyltransferase)